MSRSQERRLTYLLKERTSAELINRLHAIDPMSEEAGVIRNILRSRGELKDSL